MKRVPWLLAAIAAIMLAALPASADEKGKAGNKEGESKMQKSATGLHFPLLPTPHSLFRPQSLRRQHR